MNIREEGFREEKILNQNIAPPVFADHALARRLETAEARASASFIDARARTGPPAGAERIEVAGAAAFFDGPASPLTQTFGLGMAGPVTEADLDRIEVFFGARGAPVYHEVSPLADAALPDLLAGRGYRPVEFTSVMYRPIQPDPGLEADAGWRVRLIEPGEEDAWAGLSARGWSETPELAQFMLELGQVMAHRRDGLSFFAEWDGRPLAAGALFIHAGVALLAGASTVPEARRRGAQLALLRARLALASARGCDLAMMCALPGSASQRNAERHGFRIAYTRIKWGRR